MSHKTPTSKPYAKNPPDTSSSADTDRPEPPVEDFVATLKTSTDRSLVEVVRRLAKRLKAKTRECEKLKNQVQDLSRERARAIDLAEKAIKRHRDLVSQLEVIESQLNP